MSTVQPRNKCKFTNIYILNFIVISFEYIQRKLYVDLSLKNDLSLAQLKDDGTVYPPKIDSTQLDPTQLDPTQLYLN